MVMRLLAKDPAERYESAEDLAEELGRIRDSLPPVGASAGTQVSASATDGQVSAAESVSVGDGAGPGGADEQLLAITPGERRPRRRKLLLTVAPLAIVALLGAILLGLSRAPGGGEIIGSLEGVPGNALDEARGALEDAEWELVGPQEATIPEVEGLSEEQARQRLEERGFETEIRARESSEESAGKVLEQSAPGGERAEEGSIILLSVGEGPAFASSVSDSSDSSGGGSGDDGSGGASATN